MRLGLWLAISLVTLPASAVAQTAAVSREAASEPAIAVLRQEADAGNPEAQYKLALRYLDSTSQLHNDTEGLQWLQRAADAGHALSQVSLGLIYRSGDHGVKQDFLEAVKWLRKASEAGDPHGQSELGFMYERGEGLPKDEAEAARLYWLAADQGLPIALFDLGFMYEEGRGVPADAERAVKLYEKAASRVPTARNNFAVIYFQGKSVSRDPLKAYEWGLLTISAEYNRILAGRADLPDKRLGHALLLLKDIAKGMSKEQKSKGRSLATEWINSHASELGDEPSHFQTAISTLK
jgi:hypothetical protein